MARVDRVICGPGGLLDVRAAVMSDGAVIATKDGSTWEAATRPAAISVTSGDSWLFPGDPDYDAAAAELADRL